jgi:hypothetical protein
MHWAVKPHPHCHCGRHGTRSSCNARRSDTTTSLMSPPLAAWASCFETPLTALGRQMTFDQLAHVGERLSFGPIFDLPALCHRDTDQPRLGTLNEEAGKRSDQQRCGRCVTLFPRDQIIECVKVGREADGNPRNGAPDNDSVPHLILHFSADRSVTVQPEQDRPASPRAAPGISAMRAASIVWPPSIPRVP